MCGENQRDSLITIEYEGSPPRVRGKLVRNITLHALPGITPACAGKTESVRILEFHNEDHPRVCGENVPRFQQLQSKEGSPPRVRGKQRRR